MSNDLSHPDITLITPMYNESEHIDENINIILDALEKLEVDWEYVLVDDGSTDDSYSKAKKILADRPNCRIIHYEFNRGRGYALRQGFAVARGRYIITTESDLSWGAGIVQKLHYAILSSGSDIVIASIYLPGGGIENVPLFRRVLSSWGNVIMRWCFGNNLTMLSGMTRAYRRETIKALHLESNQKEIHLEIVAKSQALGLKITEIPAVIRWSPPKPGQPKRSNRGIAKFIVPHLLGSFSHAAFRVFFTVSLMLFFLGMVLSIFGVINKIFMITPESLRMANIVTYGLIFILISAVCALFAGLSLQITNLNRGITHIQSQLKSLQDIVEK